MADRRGARIRFVLQDARKHVAALIAIVVYNLVLFGPVLFAGRVISPNDLIQRYDPWAAMREHAVVVENPLLLDPPASYYSLMALLRNEPSAFHWNPYVGSGTPGFGSSAAAVLSPFIILPTFAVPLPWVYTAILFLKLNVAFVFAYLWLREERLGKSGAAIGAIIIAGSGIIAVRWMWQTTNATVLYPALLWLVRRAFNGRRTPIWVMTLIALAYALAGFPSTMAYGLWMAFAYAVFLAIRRPAGLPAVHRIAEGVLAGILAVAIAAPSLAALAQWIPRSGWLSYRDQLTMWSFPARHVMSFVMPERLGNPATGDWIGDRTLGIANNYVEATIYVGLAAIPLTLFALALRRRRTTRWFWIAAAIVVAGAMFGAPVIGTLVAQLPGFKYSMLTRTKALLPLPIGYLSAAGVVWIASKVPRRRIVIIAIALIASLDLAIFAQRFQPYLHRSEAAIETTPMIDFLRAEKKPFRVVPFFNYLWPNTAQMFGIEDTRSQFMSEATYRRLLLRLDHGAWSGKGTILGFNSLDFHFDDPVVGMLGVRWFLEHRAIDIVRWKTLEATVPVTPGSGTVPLDVASSVRIEVPVDVEPFWAMDVPVDVASTHGAAPRLVATLEKNGAVVWSRAYTADDIRAIGRMYVPMRPYARLGESVTLTIRSRGIRGSLESHYGRVKTPVVFERELPDGRLFRNLAEVPRFHAVSRLRKMNDDEFLANHDIDLVSEAVITDDPVMLPHVDGRDARVTLTSYGPAEQHLDVQSSTPFFLASSEKISPELGVRIDGKRVPIIEINTLFAGVVVPPGHHHIRFRRRIGRGWWRVAGAAAALWLAIAIAEVTVSLRRR